MTHDAEINDVLPLWRWTLPLAVLAWALIVGGCVVGDGGDGVSIRVGSTVMWGDLSWVVKSIETRPYGRYVTLNPTSNRRNPEWHYEVSNVAIGDVLESAS